MILRQIGDTIALALILALSGFLPQAADAKPITFKGAYVGDMGGGKSLSPLNIILKFRRQGSVYKVSGALYTSKGSSVIKGVFNPAKNRMRGTVTNAHRQQFRISGYYAASDKIFVAIVLGKYVFYLSPAASTQPQPAPVPPSPSVPAKEKYYVFLVKNASLSIYPGSYEYIQEFKKTHCSFIGGGNDCGPNDKPELEVLVGFDAPMYSLAEAQVAICDHMSGLYWQKLAGGLRGLWDGDTNKRYGIFESVSQDAFQKYCPEKLP
jgi:hypothetical protein